MDESEHPLVSVIIPVYNDPDGLKDTLESLVVQDFPPENFEIIIADNGSTDDTLKVANEFIQKYPKLIRFVIEDKVQSSYAARNKGIKASKAPIIAFIDSDMTVEEDWLSRAIESMKKKKAEYLTCNIQIYHKGKESLVTKYNRLTGFTVKRNIDLKKFGLIGCTLVRREVFEDLGYFDARLISGGDMEFGNRVYDSGRKLHFDPDIVMYHPARSSLRSLLKKSFRTGKGLGQLQRYYPKRYGRSFFGNFAAFLPAATWKFKDKINSLDELGIYEKFMFFLINFLTKIFSGFGCLIG